MKRRRVKLGLYGLTVAEIIPFCQNIIDRMTGNVSYPTPNPDLADVQLAVTDLQKANVAAEDGGKTLTANVRFKKEEVFNKMRTLRDYVNEVGNGDEEILLSSGFPLAKLPTPNDDYAVPGNVRTKTLAGKGSVGVRCNRVEGASNYQIRYRQVEPITPGEENPWHNEDPLGPTSQEVHGLPSAVYHEFQMRATGSSKPSPWSGSVQGLPA